MSERKWAELAEETENDRELRRVIRSTADGSDICLTPYVTFIDELTIVDGVILKGQRVIVPENMMTVSRCDVCQENIYTQQQQPLQMHERPDRPWAKVACDIFYLKQVPYLLTFDYYSHYPEIALLSNESSRQVIIHLKSLFSRYGIPSECISDGDPQFVSQ